MTGRTTDTITLHTLSSTVILSILVPAIATTSKGSTGMRAGSGYRVDFILRWPPGIDRLARIAAGTAGTILWCTKTRTIQDGTCYTTFTREGMSMCPTSGVKISEVT